jgi:hypothetical protein
MTLVLKVSLGNTAAMTSFGRLVIALLVVIIVAVAAIAIWRTGSPTSTPNTAATSTPQTYGMAEYTDPTYGFTFWYPSALAVTASTTKDSASFPGGTEVERLQIGTAGATYVAVVTSVQSTITDEPNGHAAPINQTKYFYDISSAKWMVSYPEGSMTGGSGATTTADVSKSTIGGLPILPSGARFDTSIIPLSTTEFLVIGDGGGSSFTARLAQTVASVGASVDPSALSAALQAESTAYQSQ